MVDIYSEELSLVHAKKEEKKISLSPDHLDRLRDPSGFLINILGALFEAERGRGINGP
jgi:hypothetical protein